MKFLLGIAFGMFVTPLMAQQRDTMATYSVPEVTVTAHGETHVTPDRATIQISVETKAPTAAAAASENATKQAAVIQAIRSAGIASEQISTVNYTVTPEQRYEPNREPVIVGYVVTNTVSVEVRRLPSVGPVIDAALNKGANMITSLQFFSSSNEEARRTAIASAVQRARLDADAAARAAGGAIGGLLEIIIGQYSSPPPRPMVMLRATAAGAPAADTPINAGEQTVSVDVTTRWRFIGK